jgi:endonuclease/exonuclease/phosphatase family metal-dependent hydrolase
MNPLIVVLLAFAYVIVVIVVNRGRKVRARIVNLDNRAGLPDTAGNEISVSTWNLGYAGLGSASDFIKDGGTRMFPPSRDAVRGNLAGIVETASGLDVDVALFQEVAGDTPLNYWISVDRALARLMGDRQYWFRHDVSTWGVPRPLRLKHGSVIASRVAARRAEIAPLPQESDPMLGLVVRLYALQVVTIASADGGPDWVIVNLHLSAFDDGAHLRREQLRAVFAFAEARYRQGGRVILGGDWNMILMHTDFESNTPDEFLSWIHDLPRDWVPEGWTVAVDPARPTVRTLYKPYVPGENFTGIIDGFIVSPNVEVVGVETRDTGFMHSDHMPVIARFRGC